LAVATAGCLVAACGQSPSGAAGASDSATANPGSTTTLARSIPGTAAASAFLARAGTANGRVRSARLTFSESSTVSQGGEAARGTVTAAGVVRFFAPVELDLSVSVRFPGLGDQLQKTIIIGSKSWSWVSGLDYPGGNKWTESPASEYSGIADALPLIGSASAVQLLEIMRHDGASVASAPSFRSDGVDYRVLTYAFSTADMARVADGRAGGMMTPVMLEEMARAYPGGISGRLYFGPTDILWRVTEQSTTASDGTRTTDVGTLTYSDYDLAVDVQPPPAADVLGAPGTTSTVPTAPTTTTTPSSSSSSSSKS